MFRHKNCSKFFEDTENWKKEVGETPWRSLLGPGEDDRGAEAEDRVVHRKGTAQFTYQGRVGEISVDLILQARAQMADYKANRLEDSVVSENIKQW